MSRTAESPLSSLMWLSHAAAVRRFDDAGSSSSRTSRASPTRATSTLNVLVDLGAVDFDVNLAGALGVGAQVAGDAVVEAHADGDQQIGFLNGVVDPGFAVHAHHAEVERIVRQGSSRCRAASWRREYCRRWTNCSKAVHRAGKHDAVAGEDQRALGGVE